MLTVYLGVAQDKRHFPDKSDLSSTCSAHPRVAKRINSLDDMDLLAALPHGVRNVISNLNTILRCLHLDQGVQHFS